MSHGTNFGYITKKSKKQKQPLGTKFWQANGTHTYILTQQHF